MNTAQHEIREELERDIDIARGLGTSLSVADLRTYSERMDWAAVSECDYSLEHEYLEGQCPECWGYGIEDGTCPTCEGHIVLGEN